MRFKHILAILLLAAAARPMGAATSSAGTFAAAADKLAIIDAFFEDPDRRIVRNLVLNAGETNYFSFKISGFRADAKQHVELEYRVQFFDPKGVPVVEDFTDKVDATLTPQDQYWMPKLNWSAVVPGTAPSGAYVLKVHVEDKNAKTTADFEATVTVRGETIEAGDKLVVHQSALADTETGRAKPDNVFHPGSQLWARYKVTGYKLVDKAYWVEGDYSVLDASGKLLFTKPDAMQEKNRLFYPPRILNATINLDVSAGVKPGEYVLRLEVRDKLGDQKITYDTPFRVEP